MSKKKFFIVRMLLLVLLLSGIPSSAFAAEYSYDELGRLKSVQYNNGSRLIMQYDKSGNLLKVTPIDNTTPIVNVTASASLAGGYYNSAKTVTLTMSEPGNIFYTLDGNIPTTYSSMYTGALTISSSQTLKFIAVDNVGNQSPVYTENYVIDMVAPDVTITSPTDPATNDKYPTLSYVVQDSSPVTTHVYLNGDTINKVSGESLTLVSDGNYTLKVQSVDAAGNSSYAQVIFIVDTIPPIVPSIAALPSTTNNSRPTLYGTGEAESTINLYIDNVLNGTTLVDVLGNWNYTPTSTVVDGSHTVKAIARDAAGNISNYSSISFTVDTIAPNAPSVSDLPLYTNNTKPLISGEAEANSLVSVYIDGTLSATTTASSLGAWSYTPETDLAINRSHSVKATATDVAGNTSVFSNIVSFIIDAIPPTISNTDPVNNATGVSTSKVISVYLNEKIFLNNPDSVTLKAGTVSIPIYCEMAATIPSSPDRAKLLYIIPQTVLSKGVKYTVNIPVDTVTDWAGNPFAVPYTFSFTTAY